MMDEKWGSEWGGAGGGVHSGCIYMIDDGWSTRQGKYPGTKKNLFLSDHRS